MRSQKHRDPIHGRAGIPQLPCRYGGHLAPVLENAQGFCNAGIVTVSSHVPTDGTSPPLLREFDFAVRFCHHVDSFQDLDPHWSHAGTDHVDFLCGDRAQVDDAASDIGAAIVNPDDHAFPVPEVDDTDDAVHGEGFVRGRELFGIEPFAAGCSLGLPVEGRLSAQNLDRFGGEERGKLLGVPGFPARSRVGDELVRGGAAGDPEHAAKRQNGEEGAD